MAQTLREFLKAVENLPPDTLLCVAEVDEAFAAHVADQVAFMEKGELVGVDVPDQILHNPQDARIQEFLRTYHERNSF